MDENKNIKQFFNDFAHQAGFDPLNPQNWYSVKIKDIMEVRVIYRRPPFKY